MSLKIDGVEIQMQRIIEDYTVEVRRAINNAEDKVAKEAVQKLRNTSPKKTGEYAKGWAIKRTKGRNGIVDVEVYNKKKPQITHLLENGHEIINEKGDYGRFNGIKHIKPVEEWAQSEFPAEIERELD